MNLAGLLGNGAGLLCLGIGVILMKSELTNGKPAAVVMRIVIVLMLAGGAGLVSAGIGVWIRRGANAVLGLFGSNTAIVIAALASFAMLLTVGIALWKKPSKKAAWTAAILPFALALVTGGVLGQIGDTTQRFANDGSSQVSSFLTGR